MDLIRRRLMRLHVSVRGFYWSIEEFMTKGHPYGTLHYDPKDLFRLVGVRKSTGFKCLSQLVKAGILTVTESGFTCPLMVRSEIRGSFAEWDRRQIERRRGERREEDHDGHRIPDLPKMPEQGPNAGSFAKWIQGV
jgi:hypothetical protein